MSDQKYLPRPEGDTPAQPKTTPAWIAVPLGMTIILVFGIVAIIVVLVGAIVTTVVTILFILFLIPVLLIALILGLVDELRHKKQAVPKGLSKPGE